MRRLRGISLVEALVAFAVLTDVLVVSLPALAGPGGQSADRVERAMAKDYARSRLAIYGTVRPLAAGERRGEAGRWVWRDRLRLASGPVDGDPVWDVTIEIFDASGRHRLARIEAVR